MPRASDGVVLLMGERIARLFGVIVTAAILLLTGWMLLDGDDPMDCREYGALVCPPSR